MRIRIEEIDEVVDRAFSHVDRAFSRMGALFDEVFDGPLELDSKRQRRPSDVRVSKSKDLVTVEVDLPGVSLDNVSINVESGDLILKWKRENSRGTSEGEYSFSISKSADVQNIGAKLSNGVLTITIPSVKQEPPSIHSVKVTSG
jgi:HSP20 family molecular chaperone IbpA